MSDETKEKPQASVASIGLLDATERKRLEQMETNVTWLINQIDAIHFAICPDQNGTWQQRAEQAVNAARKIASNSGIDGKLSIYNNNKRNNKEGI